MAILCHDELQGLIGKIPRPFYLEVAYFSGVEDGNVHTILLQILAIYRLDETPQTPGTTPPDFIKSDFSANFQDLNDLESFGHYRPLHLKNTLLLDKKAVELTNPSHSAIHCDTIYQSIALFENSFVITRRRCPHSYLPVKG